MAYNFPGRSILRRLLVAAATTLGITLILIPAYSQERDLSVLTHWDVHPDRWVERQDGSFMLYRRLNERAFELIRQRDREVAGITTAHGWLHRKAQVRNTLNEILGPWPAKSPLNAKVTGVVRKDKYRVEKVVFESQPGFHVTGALYVPEGGPAVKPGVLFIPGHRMDAFRAVGYQSQCLNLVHKGFVVLAYDPIGQGERQQEIDPVTGSQLITYKDLPSYKFHSYPGNQLYLNGISIARYFIWDAIRGIDYLVSRSEVDPERIGVTGHSGGGNLSVFTGAIDPRIKAAAPSCWLTSQRRKLQLNGIQDAENNIYHGLKHHIEHADWLLLRAPQPTLLLTTSHDHFPIQGARETAAEAQRIYDLLGYPGNFAVSEDDHDHGYTPKNSEAAYAFLMKHLGLNGDPAMKSYPPLSADELTVTKSGQVATEYKAENVFSLNRREAAPLLQRVESSRARPDYPRQPLARARELSGYQPPQQPHDVIYRGGFQRKGYRLEKWALDGGPNSVIPILLALPEGQGPFPTVVYLHPDGKTAGAAPDGLLERLTRQGFAVAAPDLIGIGETAPRIGRQNDTNAGFYIGTLVQASVVGVQSEDLAAVVRWLQSDARFQREGIGLMANGDLGPTAMHAAAFLPEIRWLFLDHSILSYESLIQNHIYKVPSSAFVPGALTAYDLPDLLAAIAPRKVVIFSPVDHAVNPYGPDAAAALLRHAVSRYHAAGAGDRLRTVTSGGAGMMELLLWSAR